ncbi:hypothetical protein TNCV_1217691 [Trichonephila clavipes]|nr:hypothetical protein TNCV_1217691 [Trichonephila clavipes]
MSGSRPMECSRPFYMAAPLSMRTKEEKRTMIRFLFAEGRKPVEIIRRRQAQQLFIAKQNLRMDRALRCENDYNLRKI